eukprot:4110248-Amphidinium_carterae.1
MMALSKDRRKETRTLTQTLIIEILLTFPVYTLHVAVGAKVESCKRVFVSLAVWKQGKSAVHVPPEKRQNKVKPLGELLL